MNHVVVILVPERADKRDGEDALREILSRLKTSEKIEHKAEPAAPVDNDELPLWTWFVPNSRP